MTTPFLPPAPPQVELTPPAPPRKQRGILRLLVIGGLTIIGLAVVTAIATRDQTDAATPAATTVARETTVVTEAPAVAAVERTERTERTEAPTLSAWVDADARLFLLDAEGVVSRTSDLSGDIVDALEREDIAGAARYSMDAYNLWADAPNAPSDIPFAPEWQAVKLASMDAYLTAAEAFVTLDMDMVDDATVKLANTADLMSDLNDAMTEATDDLDL